MSSTTPTSAHGPELLDERSVSGVLVHLLSFPTSVIGAGLVYIVSDHEFTRANARNALNWHLSVLILTLVSFIILFFGADTLTLGGEVIELSLLPPLLDTIVGVIGIGMIFVTMLAWGLTAVFTLIATLKAIFGTPWEYPFAWDFVERYS